MVEEIFSNVFNFTYDFSINKKHTKIGFKLDILKFIGIGAGVEISDFTTIIWFKFNDHLYRKNIVTNNLGRAIRTILTWIKGVIFGDNKCLDMIDDITLTDKEADELRKYKISSLKKAEGKRIRAIIKSAFEAERRRLKKKHKKEEKRKYRPYIVELAI